MIQKITTFLTFNDRAEAAVSFYVSLFKNSKVLSSRGPAKTESSRDQGFD